MADLSIVDSQPLPAALTITKSEPLPPPPQTFGEALREFGHQMNPVSMVQGMAGTVNDILTGAQAWRAQNEKIAQDAEDAFKRKDYAEAARHTLNFFLNGIPGLGASIEQAGTKLENGDIAGGLADTAALSTQIVLGEKAPAIVRGASELPGKVATLVKDPVTGKIIKGSAKVVGGAGAVAKGGPIGVAYGLDKMVSGVQDIQEALSARSVAAQQLEALGGHPKELLDAIAGEDFNKLSPEGQTNVRQIADRIKAGTTTEELTGPPNPDPNARVDTGPPVAGNTTMRDVLERDLAAARAAQGVTQTERGPLRPPLAEPNPLAPQIPPVNAGGGGPIRPPLAQPPTARPPLAFPPSIAQQLFEEAQKSGTVPAEAKPGEPIGAKEEASPEPFKEKARTSRATSAATLAETFRQHEIPADYLGAIEPGQWKQVADAVGLDWPESKAAQTKLIRETMKALRVKEGKATTASQMMQGLER